MSPTGSGVFAEKVERTVKIEASTVEIEERGVKLRLTVVDTPGFADAIDSTEWCVRQSARYTKLVTRFT